MKKEDLYEAGDVYTDYNGIKWLKLACGRWAQIWETVEEPDEYVMVNRKGVITH